MKILYYNWAPINSSGIGGGISIYLQNLFNYIAESDNNKGTQIFFISSGWFYDNSKSAYIREEKGWGQVRCFSVINSPISAPLRFAVSQLKDLFMSTSLKALLNEFIKAHGPFDIIHFHSIEGISSAVFELKDGYPNTRIIYSVHDYGLFCPNVRLWTNQGTNCYTDIDKRDCSLCMRNDMKAQNRNLAVILRPSQIESSKNSSFFEKIRSGIIYRLSRFCGLFNHNKASDYVRFRTQNVKMINQYVDSILCVSRRVAEISKYYGVKEEKLRVCYIGTKAAETAKYCARTSKDSDLFVVLYMGYATPEKGFPFLLDALESLSEDFCKTTIIKLATRIDNEESRDRIEKLKEKYYNVIIYDGYCHSDFPTIMQDVNLGIVPPQWEDNLPQVAIEMIANGVPVMASSYGGAHELNNHQCFMFNDKIDLINKLQMIKRNRSLLDKYWDECRKLTTMSMHWGELKDIYKLV